MPKLLHETDNYHCSIPNVNAGKIAAYIHIAEEFMGLGMGRIKAVSNSEVGFYRYSVSVFCLGHAFELLYKALLLADAKDNDKVHCFGKLYLGLGESRRSDLTCIIVDAGWSSVDEFHEFMSEEIDHVNRKYYDARSGWDFWTYDATGKKLDHKLWPSLVQLWNQLHDYTASQVWKNPDLPISERAD